VPVGWYKRKILAAKGQILRNHFVHENKSDIDEIKPEYVQELTLCERMVKFLKSQLQIKTLKPLKLCKVSFAFINRFKTKTYNCKDWFGISVCNLTIENLKICIIIFAFAFSQCIAPHHVKKIVVCLFCLLHCLIQSNRR
jgi:hypothetical protein